MILVKLKDYSIHDPSYAKHPKICIAHDSFFFLFSFYFFIEGGEIKNF